MDPTNGVSAGGGHIVSAESRPPPRVSSTPSSAAFRARVAASRSYGSPGGRGDGFSRFGLMAGYDHAGSGLFAHIIRLCEALRPSLVFLENVPGIIAMGMDRVRAELGVRCGYELRWCVCSAEQVGAPHLRRRWFCLAVRNDDAARALVRSVGLQYPAVADWSWQDPPEPPRMVPDNSTRRTRCAALGIGRPPESSGGRPRANAVVPSAVRTAFLALCRFDPDTSTLRPRKDDARYPTNGFIRSDNTVWDWRPSLPNGRAWVSLSFDPSTYSNPGRRQRSKQRHPDMVEAVAATRWSTPRHGGVYASNVLVAPCLRPTDESHGAPPTKRSMCDLPTQVRFERGTPDDVRELQISAEFIEWAMGFPPGWTQPSDAHPPVRASKRSKKEPVPPPTADA